jgi:small ligand-binding sensory domain FIST
MPFAAALSEHPLPTHATGEVIGQVLEAIGPAPDVAVVFVTAPLTGALEDIATAIRATLQPGTLIGATAVSVLGGEREVEERSAISLFAARIGPVTPMRVEAERLVDGWRLDRSPTGSIGAGTLVLLTDPYSFPVDRFLAELAVEEPELQVIGGQASAASGPGGNRLVLDGTVVDEGAVGVLFGPMTRVTTLVSQGCRPIGHAMVVTRAERNMIYEIAGRPALDRLNEVASNLSRDDRALLGQGVHIGRVMDERRTDFGRGDFLVRQVIGADMEAKALAVGDEIEVGTTVQFHVRDADTADEDLRAMLAGAPAQAALVFTCNGRGTRLFDEPHHDASVINAWLDGGATAGMFCAGEVGPVGGRNFVHGFTASVLLFEET